MTESDWKLIKHFSPKENWGDSSKISLDLVKELDAFREALGLSILVTCGTQGSHIEDSQHYLGLAADIVIPEGHAIDLLDYFFMASRFGFRGIGLYPDWRCEGRVTGGLHLDVRQGPRAYWIGVRNEKGGNDYYELSLDNLVRFHIV